MFYFHLVFGCKGRFAIWLSPDSCLMLFPLVASFEKCMGELVNWIVKYHFSTSVSVWKTLLNNAKCDSDQEYFEVLKHGTHFSDWLNIHTNGLLNSDLGYTKTWNPLLWWTIHTNGLLNPNPDITKTWNPLLWQQSAFRDWSAHCILDEVYSLWIGWNCVLTSDLYIYVCDIYIGPKSVIRLLLIGWPQWFAKVLTY